MKLYRKISVVPIPNSWLWFAKWQEDLEIYTYVACVTLVNISFVGAASMFASWTNRVYVLTWISTVYKVVGERRKTLMPVYLDCSNQKYEESRNSTRKIEFYHPHAKIVTRTFCLGAFCPATLRPLYVIRWTPCSAAIRPVDNLFTSYWHHKTYETFF